MWMIYVPTLERSPSSQPCSCVSWEQNGCYAAQDFLSLVLSLKYRLTKLSPSFWITLCVCVCVCIYILLSEPDFSVLPSDNTPPTLTTLSFIIRHYVKPKSHFWNSAGCKQIARGLLFACQDTLSEQQTSALRDAGQTLYHTDVRKLNRHVACACFSFLSVYLCITASLPLYKRPWLLYVPPDYNPEILHSAHTGYVCVLCGSENKQRSFLYTALTDWFS